VNEVVAEFAIIDEFLGVQPGVSSISNKDIQFPSDKRGSPKLGIGMFHDS
jgi:hypothetical protein